MEKLEFFLEKFIKVISNYIETEEILKKLLEKIEEIKDKKIEQINVEDIFSKYSFNRKIFSEYEKKYILENLSTLNIIDLILLPKYKVIPYLKKYLENHSLDVKDSLIVYVIYLHIDNEKNKKRYIPKLDSIKKEEVIYLDYNIFHKYKKYKKIISKLLQEKKLNLVYSPIHAEEIIRITNKSEKNKCILSINRDVKVFFKNRKILYNDENITIEKFNHSIKRAMNNPIGKINDVIKIYDYENPEGIFSEIKKKIDEFFKKNEIEYGIYNDKNLSFILDKWEFIKEQLLYLLQIDNSNKIFYVYIFMDIIGYNVDKKIRGFRSSFYDCLHVEYAEGTKYFVTKDKKLAKRAEAIYNFLGIKTGVYLLNGNKLELKKEYGDEKQ